MKTVKQRMTKSKIIRIVEEALKPHQPSDYRITVVDHKGAVEKHGDTWFVVLEPSREDVKSYDFGARMAEAGADLMDRDDVIIQLTTVMPSHVG
jgi:hypothetical protein